MGDVTQQSNAGNHSMGDGLNPTVFTSNAGPDIGMEQENVVFGTYRIDMPIGNNFQRAFIEWQPFSDSNGSKRFMANLTPAVDLFNYYCLKRVEYVFFISACWSTGSAWEPGPPLLRIVPWTGNIETGPDTGNQAFAIASLLPNCQHYMLYIEHGRNSNVDPGTGSVDLQRQARVICFPQYKQDAEPVGTPRLKTNYNQAPLQIYSDVGQDNTTWRGIYLNLTTTVPNSDISPHTIFISFTVKYTVQFSGRRWLPAVPAADYRLNLGHLTSWDQDLTWKRVLVSLSSMGTMVLSILGSQSHMCQTNQGPHRHWLIKMNRQIRKSQFPLVLRQTC